MTENQIIELGFEKEFHADNEDLYYYTCDIALGLCLITQMNDEVKDGNWYVEFFDTTPSIRFTEAEDAKQLLDILKSKIHYE